MFFCVSEVIAQNAVVEQQLHIVAFQLESVGIVALVFYLRILSRFLFHQKHGVSIFVRQWGRGADGHQVDTTLQS